MSDAIEVVVVRPPDRGDCWCGGYRKPCAYHEGWEDALSGKRMVLRQAFRWDTQDALTVDWEPGFNGRPFYVEEET